MAMGGYTALVFMFFVMDRDGISQAATCTFDTMFDEVLALKSNVVEHVQQSAKSAAQAIVTTTTPGLCGIYFFPRPQFTASEFAHCFAYDKIDLQAFTSNSC